MIILRENGKNNGSPNGDERQINGQWDVAGIQEK